MLFTDEVRWTGADFIAAAAIFAVVGCAIELIVRFVDQSGLRTALVCGVILAALATWADGTAASSSLCVGTVTFRPFRFCLNSEVRP